MVKLALLGDTYPSQLQANPQAMRDLEVVWVGSSLEAFRAEVPALRPQVLALDFVDLGKVPERLVPELLSLTGAAHAVVSYRLTHHGMLQALTSQRIRFVQGPLPLSLLRTHVHRALEEARQARRQEVPQGPAQTPKPPRFTHEQLGRLLEVVATVKCECPNHLAQLISGLRAFEEYSKDCESRDEKDQRMHALLYRQTAVAREAMEDGLLALLEHENIQL
ncbi:hypothetical protein ATI61_112121 [Archangium gephyra]|uniref:Regulatory protein, MerR n=1 Tax=Archangium gephyra TaxID=48 RepID=A0AAC8Q4B7_9BACT|nr:hypothetical protein [Archangium gephyra]AKJ00860.1 Regulatory protein, MerR [Archangium gephyra]REG26026.1 hypothetical protein ATI61_112121 [Archangium gephyra]